MQKNVLIGIGGTGSRVIESVVHLCAAGLGPDKLHIFMIDPDMGNGNLTRTKSLIKKYTEFRAGFQRTSGNPCFKTEIIIPPGDESFVWGIFDERDYTLGKFINHDNLKKTNPDLADLANVLFTQKELNTQLNEGFRGHPSIGAVVMSDPPMDEYPFKLLWEGITALHANELRVFLVGSIFGGTGAAGFPTLGSRKLIKYNEAMQAKLAGEKSKVLLGGALILPYFSFSVDNPGEDDQMFVTANDFPIATKAALQYYNDKELGFDQYYFVGDSLSQEVGEFSMGSSSQENYPHYVEMVSAFAGFDFFGQPAIDDVPDKKYFIACRETEKLDWNMIPLSRDSVALQEQRKSFKEKIVDFTVFAYTYLTYGRSILSRTHKEVMLEAWYSDNFKKNFKEESALFNPRHEENKALYNVANDFLNDFLFWICAMDDGDKVELIDKEKLVNGEISLKKKLDLKDPEKFIANIGLVLKERTNKLTFNAFKTQGLQETIINDGSMNAGSKYLNIFYLATAKFNRKNLEIK